MDLRCMPVKLVGWCRRHWVYNISLLFPSRWLVLTLLARDTTLLVRRCVTSSAFWPLAVCTGPGTPVCWKRRRPRTMFAMHWVGVTWLLKTVMAVCQEKRWIIKLKGFEVEKLYNSWIIFNWLMARCPLVYIIYT